MIKVDDFYRIIQNEFVDEKKKSSFYIFNTYFLEKLKAFKKGEKDEAIEEEIDFEKTYNNVKKVKVSLK